MSQPNDVPWAPKAEPHLPPWGSGEAEIVYAIRAMQGGIANAEQQRIAWRYMMFVSGASQEFDGLSYRPDGPIGGERATTFAEGKRFVGLMISKLLRPEYTPKSEVQAAPQAIQKRLRERSKQRSV